MTNQIANLKLIKVLLESDVSAYEIEAKTGVTRVSISKFRTGKADLDNMAIKTAIALTTFAENQINIKAGELLDRMKHSTAFVYVIKSGNHYLTNDDTNNMQSLYNIKDDEHFYGVYGDLVNGRVDSRTHSDKEIKVAIKKMLSEGNIADRP